MKTFIFLILLIPTMTMINAQSRRHIDSGQQQVIRIGTNPEILINGAYDYDSSHLAITFDWVNKFESGIEVGITAEFVELDPYYFAGGFQGNFPMIFKDRNGFEALIGIEAMFINRGIAPVNDDGQQLGNTWLSAKVKAIARYNLNDLLDLNLILSGQTRQDTNILWNGDKYSWGVHFKVGFKFY